MNYTLDTIEKTIAASWWLVLARGVCGILLGLTAFFAPISTAIIFVQFVGAYFLVDGIFSVAAAITGAAAKNEGVWIFLKGLLGIIAGVVVFSYPMMATIVTGLYIIYFVAACLLLSGIADISYGIRLRKVIHNEWAYIFGGLLSIALGICFALAPGISATALMMLVGISGITIGIFTVALALKLRNYKKDLSGKDRPISPYREKSSASV